MKKTILQLSPQWKIKVRKTKNHRKKNRDLKKNMKEDQEDMTIGAKALTLRKLSKMGILKQKMMSMMKRKSQNNTNLKKN